MTSDGKPKILARFDCSGDGDVDTSTVVQSEEGFITGITGRKLKVIIFYYLVFFFFILFVFYLF